MALRKAKRRQFTPEELKQWTEVVDIRKLRPHPDNPHLGDTDKIGRSLTAHGQFRTIVISKDDVVLMGNHTYAASMEQEKTRMAVIRLPLNHDHPQALEVMLADNAAGKDAGEDEGILQAVLEGIKEAQGDLEGTLWEDDYLKRLQREEKVQGRTDADDAPGVPKKPFAKTGDLWHLGEHRLLCGDSSKMEAIARLMGKRRADMVFTDPPYNANYSPVVTRKRPGRKEWEQGIQGDNVGVATFRRFLERAFLGVQASIHPGASLYVCTDWPSYPDMMIAFRRFWSQRSLLVWDKGHFGLGSQYRPQYELVIFGVKGDKPAHWNAGQRERDLWRIDREKKMEYRHPTQKPVELVERALNNSSNREHLVLDPFGGSGTTLMACQRSGRLCYMVELDPGFVDVICRRWQEFTTEKPTLDGKAHDFTT
jgi:DNA modification methylase